MFYFEIYEEPKTKVLHISVAISSLNTSAAAVLVTM